MLKLLFVPTQIEKGCSDAIDIISIGSILSGNEFKTELNLFNPSIK